MTAQGRSPFKRSREEIDAMRARFDGCRSWVTVAREFGLPSGTAARVAVDRQGGYVRETSSTPSVATLPAPPHGCRVRARGSSATWAVALGDVHIPFHDQRALDLVSFVIEDLKGEGDPELIQVGDYLDQQEVSRHSKDPDVAVSLDKEFEVGRQVRARLDGLRSWSRKTKTKGNHDVRLRKYILENAPAVRNLVPSAEVLLEMPQNDWNVVQYGERYVFGDLNITHDLDTAGKYAHDRSMVAMGGSTLIGHTHRIAMSCTGTIVQGPITAAMIGWLGDFEFAQYIKRPLRAHWRHGFGLLHRDPLNHVHVTPVEIAGGRCVAHGKLYDLAQLAKRKAA